MADETQKPVPTGEPGPGPSSAPSIDPEQYKQLLDYYQQTAPFVEKVRPYYDDINRFVDDESAREVAKNAWAGYEAIQMQGQPEVPKWAQEIQDQNKKLVTYVETLQQQTQMSNAANRISQIAQERWPQLSENNFQNDLFRELQEEAKAAGVGTVDGFVAYLDGLSKRMPKVEAKAEPAAPKKPPTSLRGEGSLPGIPRPSQPQFKNNVERRAFMREQMRKAAGS